MTITRRLRRIFNTDGRTVIVPMDHGLIFGETVGLCEPARLIDAIARGGADAALVPAGMAQRYAAELAPLSLVLRADRSAPAPGETEAAGACCAGVEQCLRLGADAVMAFGFPGAPAGEASLQRLADLTSEAHRWGLPVLAEMLPGGFERLDRMLTLDSLLRASPPTWASTALSCPTCPAWSVLPRPATYRLWLLAARRPGFPVCRRSRGHRRGCGRRCHRPERVSGP